jgi:hypothetical protein
MAYSVYAMDKSVSRGVQTFCTPLVS